MQKKSLKSIDYTVINKIKNSYLKLNLKNHINYGLHNILEKQILSKRILNAINKFKILVTKLNSCMSRDFYFFKQNYFFFFTFYSSFAKNMY